MAEVENTGDRRQVRAAESRIKRREQRFFDALRAVLGTQEGRLVFGDLEHGMLARAGVFRSVFNAHGGIQGMNIGRQNYGHELMALIIRADEELYERMETECRARRRRDDAETEIAHKREAETKDDDQ